MTTRKTSIQFTHRKFVYISNSKWVGHKVKFQLGQQQRCADNDFVDKITLPLELTNTT